MTASTQQSWYMKFKQGLCKKYTDSITFLLLAKIFSQILKEKETLRNTLGKENFNLVKVHVERR